MASRIGQFCISVTDLEKAEHFYTTVMGLQVQERIEIPDAKEIIVGSEGSDGQLQLAQKTAQEGAIDHGDEALWKFYLYTDELESIYQKAMDYGCQSGMEPTRLEEWKATVAFIVDPDGYKIEMVQLDS